MRVFDKLTFNGVGVLTARDGNVSSYPVPCSSHHYIRDSVEGDFVHATPYRHIRVSGSGTVSQQTWYWVQGDEPWKRDYQYSGPMVPAFGSIPYVSYAEENYMPSLALVYNSRLSDKSDNRCLANCADGKFQLGNTLVELCESVSHITSSLETLLRVLIDIKHGRFSNALKQLGIRKSYMSRPLSSRWLEAQLAIKPLIGEIEQARRLAADASIEHWYCITATGTARENYRHYDGTRITDMSLRLTTDAKWSISDSDLRFLMQIGLANPAELLWEVLPLSWVADYVVGVGDWIRALFAPMGCVHVTTSRSYRVKGTIHTYEFHSYISGSSKVQQESQGVIKIDGFQRFPDIFAPIPHLQYKLPLNVTQLMNIAALVDLFSRGRRSPN